MKVSHILYKVKDLDEAVRKYRADGFVVEYGKPKNPPIMHWFIFQRVHF